MKSKVVFVIAMLLLIGIVLGSASFALSVADEYDDIVTSQKKPSSSQPNPPDEQEPEDPPTNPDVPEDSSAVLLKKDGYFSEARLGQYGYYKKILFNGADSWQLQDGKVLNYWGFGSGCWEIRNSEPGWVSEPVIQYSYQGFDQNPDSIRERFGSMYFYYQICRDGVWEETLYLLDGSLFSVYVQNVPLYGEMNQPDINKAVEVNGFYQFSLENSRKYYISISLKEQFPTDIEYVNFYMLINLDTGVN